jgi:hypothetical protein
MVAEHKYVEAISILNDTLLNRNDEKVCMARFGQLLDFCLDNFPHPDPKDPEVQAQARRILSAVDKNPQAFTEQELVQSPPVVMDSMIAMAFSKFLLRYQSLPADPAKIGPSFDRFHKIYSQIIIGALDK